MQLLSKVLLSINWVYLANAVPLNKTEADLGVQAIARYVFVCNDNSLANYCRGSPYNFRCTLEGYMQSDVPVDICRDKTRCSCELQAQGCSPINPIC
ncbi:hypothetical protein M441DRAFT_85019 [Trichoderma asperellum CBS 433.97]|uniref:Uncharacterized protein n=1 Tax=Trichoderma asperellum (strain ATCC 204424 / CBS 433.97 / NBRC 101777) TaxID=1042311 RepID=A0A2T3YQP7_TRIA4|nr:hypothetical protein M441DRAFT_85019 [Trichoderma asperellum CBS 433.97]PTB34893.1 hypothetical protein M441DRAFT_85019 [Trichoderma asperellum CBS 433.97]